MGGPAHAGINLTLYSGIPPEERRPCTRRDQPAEWPRRLYFFAAALHTQGSTLGEGLSKIMEAGGPAHAGINLYGSASRRPGVWRPCTRRDQPLSLSLGRWRHWAALPSRTEDRTFQLTFLLPSTRTGISTQSHKLPRAKPKPKPKQQRVKTLKVNTEPTQERLETRRVYDRARNQTPNRKAYNQEHQRKYRRQNIEKGLCRDCRKPAIEGQTRCETCRDKHRARCRRSSADAYAQKLKA